MADPEADSGMTVPMPPAVQLSAIAPPARDHSPAISSPLNPEAGSKPKPVRPPAREREQREKKDSLKKRESALTEGNASTASIPSKRKAPSSATATAPSPMRWTIPPPRLSDYEPPRPTAFLSHEPLPLITPDGEIELKKPLDHAENKRGYRYSHCVADPLFRHKQFYRETDTEPFGARMSFEDTDKWMHFDTTGRFVTNEKGWRMARGNACAREGRLYFEVRIVRGIPVGDETVSGGQVGPLPHVRMGWARREASLDAPVGFDGYSYGITDARFETMHRSRSGKLFVRSAAKKQPGKTTGTKQTKEILDLKDDIREGDVVGLEINLPSMSLHKKIASGIYNPAVDLGDGFDDTPDTHDPNSEPYDIIRDRIAVPYKGNVYFEVMDYVSTRAMDAYSDRTLSLSTLSSSTTGPNAVIKVAPNTNHPEPSLRTLPHSSIKVYKNGELVGTAFEDLLAFLPPASAPGKVPSAREGFDDGMLGYFPAIACFSGGIAEVNFGQDGFWMPPPHLRSSAGSDGDGTGSASRPLARELRSVAERFKEQVAEDVVWDVIDEVDFFMQDGGFGGRVGAGAGDARHGGASLREEAD